MPKVYTMA